jgi:cytochrome c biogenesis protein CcmG/thiol:disulfide interchange protein DsbE
VLINFWATWCAPCKLEHPLLVEMRAQGVEIVGVLYKDPNGLDGARQILVQDGNPFAAVGLDPSGDLGIDMGLSGVPESFLIDAQGQIIKTKRNYFVDQDVTDFVAAYRAEKAKLSGAAGG